MFGGIADPSKEKEPDPPPKPGERDGEVEELEAKDELEGGRMGKAETDVQSTLDQFECNQLAIMD
eukprot:6334177-Alexandrium_andersonii.AAC.1